MFVLDKLMFVYEYRDSWFNVIFHARGFASIGSLVSGEIIGTCAGLGHATRRNQAGSVS